MSKISIKLHTNKDTGDININVKSECTLSELRASIGYLMIGFAGNTSIEALEELFKEIKTEIGSKDES